jgi:hypothetical protein
VVDAHRVADRPADLPVDRGVLRDDQTDAPPRAGAVVLDQPLVDLAERTGEMGEDRSLHEAVTQRHSTDPARLKKRSILRRSQHAGVFSGDCHGLPSPH